MVNSPALFSDSLTNILLLRSNSISLASKVIGFATVTVIEQAFSPFISLALRFVEGEISKRVINKRLFRRTVDIANFL